MGALLPLNTSAPRYAPEKLSVHILLEVIIGVFGTTSTAEVTTSYPASYPDP